MNDRRKLLVVLASGGFAAPLTPFAQQQGKVWRVGFLSSRARPVSLDADFFGGFPQAMRELGHIESRNLTIDWRFGDGQYERLPGLAAELVQLKVDVIIAAGTPATSAAQQATATIPIVMISVGDPVGSGFVNSLARPGGNITGLSLLSELGPKLLELLLSMVPKLSHAAILMNPANMATAPFMKTIEAEAQKINVKLLPVEARTAQEIESAFSMMPREQVGGVVLSRDPFFTQQHRQIAELAAKHRLPSISGNQAYAEAGGLMGYGSSTTDHLRRAAIYVDRIFKGAKPADLPVELPATFELIINGKTAKALGISIPRSILVRADKLIE